jgi:hypothetical protein
MRPDDKRSKDDEGATYFARAFKSLTEEHAGGRFSNTGRPTLTGTSATGPLVAPDWSVDPVPAEPPLGADVNELPDLGFPNAERIAQRQRDALKRRV